MHDFYIALSKCVLQPRLFDHGRVSKATTSHYWSATITNVQTSADEGEGVGQDCPVVEHFLNRAQVEEKLGLARGSAARLRLPEPDVTVGPINPDGTLPRGTTRGWRLETIQRWVSSRPGRGARTDLPEPDK